ncbi:MAG: Uncharacterized protein XE10_1441 [Methanoculleus marisnigri]|uniref:Uncharacterized protein n=1 Tax=Methanoculleus marisnigri TaxID=2198 RepID=A0A101ISI3_9EURY|nr:MAG: Uncharacterized protein XE10_1441 [Methanoculleus marisnigri]
MRVAKFCRSGAGAPKVRLAMGGEALRNGPGETYYAQYVTFTRTTVRLSSYQDDAIRTAVETWADAVGALA